jgi:hypothetical protein
MQGSSIRTIVVTGTILFGIVSGALVGANASGTTQQAVDEACENAVWPMIPAACFAREPARDSSRAEISSEAGQLIFVADQHLGPSPTETSKKADRLQTTDSGKIRYRTIETRQNGISVLTREEIR